MNPTSTDGPPTLPDGGRAASSTSITSDREDDHGGRRPANDNRPPDGRDADREVDASERLDAVVLSIARLIGRRMARENFEKAMRAANDNKLPNTGATEDGADEE